MVDLASDANEVLSRTTAIILAGGRGTRISAIYPDIPKPMVPASGNPFIHWVVSWLKQQGLSDLVLSIGHMAHAIEDWARTETSLDHGLKCRREERALGTGGGALNCLDLSSDFVLVTNGDSLVAADLRPHFPRMDQEGLDALVFGVEVDDASRYGTLIAGPNGSLVGFCEKQPGRGLVNAGIYMFRREILEPFPKNSPSSMELDILPELLASGQPIGVASLSFSDFLDIGTPESVHRATEFIQRNLHYFGDTKLI